MKLRTLRLSQAQHICVFGAPFSGKTELVGRLAEKYELIWFDLDNGVSTLTKLPEEWQDRIDVIRLPDTRAFPIGIETILKVLAASKEVSICVTHGKVDCQLCKKAEAPVTTIDLTKLDVSRHVVVFDSGTQIANSAMANITKNCADDYKYDWDDYRKQGALMDKVLGLIQQASYNVCLITHEAEVEMDDGKKKLVPVAGTTNFSRNTAKYFDHVVHAEVRNKKHTFGSGTNFSMSALTGSRSGIEIEKQKEGEQSLLPFFPATAATSSSGAVRSLPSSEATTAESKSEATNASISRREQLRAAGRK